jgi:ABC-type polysaccharide/polyol phosphate export permease
MVIGVIDQDTRLTFDVLRLIDEITFVKNIKVIMTLGIGLCPLSFFSQLISHCQSALCLVEKLYSNQYKLMILFINRIILFSLMYSLMFIFVLFSRICCTNFVFTFPLINIDKRSARLLSPTNSISISFSIN